MSTPRSRGAIVIDTDVFSADLVPSSLLAERYAPLITGRPALISFQTVAELRYGAIRRGWGQARMQKLDAKVHRAEVVHTAPELVALCARSYALTVRRSAMRWRSASTTRTDGSPQTAVRIGVPLVSNDGIFRDVPGLVIESLWADRAS